MNFNEYQVGARATAIYPQDKALEYCTLGLVGEAGEVAEKVKKYIRDDTPFAQLREDLKKEISDVLWYCANLAHEVDLNLDDIAQYNLDKLQSRKERGVLQGSGDDR